MATTRPNLILILADQFRRDALGKGTPHLSALARSGVRFDNAYCNAPLCGPSGRPDGTRTPPGGRTVNPQVCALKA